MEPTMKSAIYLRFIIGSLLLAFSGGNLIAAKKAPTYVSSGIGYPSLSFQADNEGSESTASSTVDVEYEPDVPLVGFVGISWRGFSLSLSQQLEDDGSKMTFSDYKIGLNFSWIGFDMSYSEFSRFKISSGKGFSNSIESRNKSRNDLDVSLISTNIYIFPLSLGFDFNTAFEPALPKTSGIALGLILNGNQLEVSTEQGFIPAVWQDDFGSDGGFSKGTLTGRGAHLAISGVLSVKGMYFSGLYSVGPGSQDYEYTARDTERSGSGDTVNTNIKGNIGFVGKSFFTTLEGSLDTPSYTLKHMSLSASRQEARLILGYKW